MRLLVPKPDPKPFPSLGGPICDFIEEKLCHGPGDVLGDPVTLTTEVAAFVFRAYEVYPKGHTLAGRRRFKRVVLSRRKGWSKTELAAWLAIVEMDPDGPVRFDGWNAKGEPVGRPVRDPYIPMVAYTEDQTEDLAYAAVYEILARSKLTDDYDIGLERIAHARAPGKIQALASAPGARDGARTTFQHFDETHLFNADRLRRTHATMQRNIPKRKAADPWSLETTTSFAPGEDSIAEQAYEYAKAISEGRAKGDAQLLFDHLQSDEALDISKPAQLRKAVVQASGDAIAWADVETIVRAFADPTADENENRRFWLNQPRQRKDQWPPALVWPTLAKPRQLAEQTEIVLGFDGSYSRDSTALVGCTVEAVPYLFEVRTWERDVHKPQWRTPRTEVEEQIREAMKTYRVLELAPDPPGWHREIEDWESTYGEIVVRFETNQPSRMGPATDMMEQAIRDGSLTHDGSEVITRHLQNAVVVEKRGQRLLTKDDRDSPRKIDAGIAAIVAHARAMWHVNNRQPSGEPLIAVVGR